MHYAVQLVLLLITATWLFKTFSFQASAAFVVVVGYFIREIRKTFNLDEIHLKRKRVDELKSIARKMGIRPKNLKKRELIDRIIEATKQRKSNRTKLWLPILIVLIALLLSLFAFPNKLSTLEKVQSKIEKIDNSLDARVHVDLGFSFYIALTTNQIDDNRRKFIFDYGEKENKNRVSLYFDIHNNLIFRLINEHGETNSCIVPNTSYTFHEGVPFFIYCEAGSSSDYSYMRIRINDREISRNHVGFKTNYISSDLYDKSKISSFTMGRKLYGLEPNLPRKIFFNPNYIGTICSDINEANPSNFWAHEFRILGWILDEEEIDKIWEEVRDNVFDKSSRITKLINPLKSAYKVDTNGNFVVIE